MQLKFSNIVEKLKILLSSSDSKATVVPAKPMKTSPGPAVNRASLRPSIIEPIAFLWVCKVLRTRPKMPSSLYRTLID